MWGLAPASSEASRLSSEESRGTITGGGGTRGGDGLVWFGLASTRPVVCGATLTVHARPKAWECESVTSSYSRALPASPTVHAARCPLFSCHGRPTPSAGCGPLHVSVTKNCSMAHMGVFLPVQSVPMPIYGGLFASAKCPHAHIGGPFCQCKVSPCLYMWRGSRAPRGSRGVSPREATAAAYCSLLYSHSSALVPRHLAHRVVFAAGLSAPLSRPKHAQLHCRQPGPLRFESPHVRCPSLVTPAHGGVHHLLGRGRACRRGTRTWCKGAHGHA